MKCRICNNNSDNDKYDVKEMMIGCGEVFGYFHCSKCGCLQINEIPEDVARYYPDNYYSYRKKLESSWLKKVIVRMRDRYALFNKGIVGKIAYLKYPNQYLRCLLPLRIAEDTRILDVGCGAGHLLFSLRELGVKNLLGVDPFNASDIRYKNGLLIKKIKIQDVTGKWDVVMFHHSFEHIPDPIETLKSVSRLLANGGSCVIRIPTTSSFAWKHYKENWVQLDAPRHFYLHSVQSMQLLADMADMDLVKVEYDSTELQFWGSEQYVQGIPLMHKDSYLNNRRNSIFSNQDMENFTRRANELNSKRMGDQAIFYLARRGGSSL